MDKKDIIGVAQVAGGGYLGYQGLKHGLPRAAGIRIEYHITSNDNAKLIRKDRNILNPEFGGKNGWGQKINRTKYLKNSKGYVHITGRHKDFNFSSKWNAKLEKYPFLKKPLTSIQRKAQMFMYKTVGNVDYIEIRKFFDSKPKDKLKLMFKHLPQIIKNNNTTTFCVSGIDSYFNENFIPDVNDVALKSTKKVKVYNNRFSAMVAGLKKFGLKGIKENKSRVAFGVGLVTSGLYGAGKLINKGIDNIKNK